MVLKYLLDNGLPTTLSKGMILLRRSLNKSKKLRAIALAEHWAYLMVETQNMCLVESQDICLVETQDMCCVES